MCVSFHLSIGSLDFLIIVEWIVSIIDKQPQILLHDGENKERARGKTRGTNIIITAFR